MNCSVRTSIISYSSLEIISLLCLGTPHPLPIPLFSPSANMVDMRPVYQTSPSRSCKISKLQENIQPYLTPWCVMNAFMLPFAVLRMISRCSSRYGISTHPQALLFSCSLAISLSLSLRVNNSPHSFWLDQDFSTLSNDWCFTAPPPIAARTFRLKPSRFERRSSAASLFSGSEALGSRKRNYNPEVHISNHRALIN